MDGANTSNETGTARSPWCDGSYRPKAQSRTFASRIFFLNVAWLLALGSGCSLLSDPTWSRELEKQDEPSAVVAQSSSSLPRLNANSLPLHAEFLHVPLDAIDEDWWAEVDETILEPEVRHSWLRNGFRIGVVRGSDEALVPLRQASRPVDAETELLTGAGVAGGSPSGARTIPLRLGRRHEMPLSPNLAGEPALLLKTRVGIRGHHLPSPQMVLSLTPEPGGHTNRCTLQIQAEVHHGVSRQRFVAGDAAIRMAASRDKWVLEGLHVAWPTQPAHTLIIAPATGGDDGETFGLGGQILHDPDHLQDGRYVVVCLRVDAT
ncbi:MAG: hypothetical protein AAGD07_17745 [Planctomycetota bacterium]